MIRVPNFKDPEVTKFLTNFVKDFEDTKKLYLSRITANRSILLISENGEVFRVTVSNSGVLQTDQVYDPV